MIRRPPRSTLDRSSAASDVYKRQEGHPSEVMDMSFANQFLSQVRLAEMDKSDTRWENKVYDITLEQDQMIAKMKLETMGINIDSLTSDQIEYMNEYAVGT